MEKIQNNKKLRNIVIILMLLFIAFIIFFVLKNYKKNNSAKQEKMIVDNSSVGLVKNENSQNAKYLVGPYSFWLESCELIESIIEVKDEDEKTVETGITDINGNELNNIKENDKFYLEFNELPEGKTYTLYITTKVKNLKGENVDIPIDLKINFEDSNSIGEIDLVTCDKNGNIETGKTVILFNENEDELGRSVSGRDGKINYYKVPKGKYKLVKIDENEIEENTKEIEVIGGEVTSVNI